MKSIILASQSPRRKELLSRMGVAFEAIPSHFDEKLNDALPAEEVAGELALGKAREVARQHPDSIVIGSDTIVTIHGKQLEKPRDSTEAKEMLTMLSGASNDVSTGVAVVCIADGFEMVRADTTKVCFKPYDEAAIDRYVATGDPLDKAGAYGIQSGAASLIDHIDGQYDTVIGLPTTLLVLMLSELGVTARAVELESPVRRSRVGPEPAHPY